MGSSSGSVAARSTPVRCACQITPAHDAAIRDGASIKVQSKRFRPPIRSDASHVSTGGITRASSSSLDWTMMLSSTSAAEEAQPPPLPPATAARSSSTTTKEQGSRHHHAHHLHHRRRHQHQQQELELQKRRKASVSDRCWGGCPCFDRRLIRCSLPRYPTHTAEEHGGARGARQLRGVDRVVVRKRRLVHVWRWIACTIPLSSTALRHRAYPP